MSYAAAQLALEVQLATPLASWLVQWPNGPKIKPAGSPYAEVSHMPGRSFVDTLGHSGRDVIPGVTQLDLYFVLETGSNVVAAMCDTVRESFKAGQWIGDDQPVLITACGPGPAYREGSYFKSIVTIGWEARIAR